REGLADRDHLADEADQGAIVIADRRPVDPADLVALAIGVVVAALGAPELVAREQHRRAERQQQGGEEIALLALAQLPDRRIVGRALDAAVPRPVVGMAVAIVLA